MLRPHGVKASIVDPATNQIRAEARLQQLMAQPQHPSVAPTTATKRGFAHITAKATR